MVRLISRPGAHRFGPDRIMCLIALLCVLGFPSPADATGQDLPDPTAILSAVREATGHESLLEMPDGLLLTGEALQQGERVEYSLLFNPGGRFREETGGRLASAIVVDGNTGWTVDWSGVPCHLELASLDVARTYFLVRTGLWLTEGGPLTIVGIRESEENERLELEMHLAKSAIPIWLEVESETSLPVRLYINWDGGMEWFFSDYRSFDGVRLAHRVKCREVPTGHVDLFDVHEIALAPRYFEDPFALNPQPPSGTLFRSNQPAHVELKRTDSGHLLVHPLVDGKDVGWFIFDTGAGAMVITPEVGDSLGMPAFGEVTALGTAGATTAHFRQGKSFELGRVTIRAPIYVEIELSFLTPIFGVPVAGICGYDVMARTVVEFDPQTPALAFMDPATYCRPVGNWQEVFLDDKLPHLLARFEGEHEGFFRLDTGYSGTATFYGGAVGRFGLLKGRETTEGQERGVGGERPVRVGTVEWFEIGGHRIETPAARFHAPSLGPFSQDQCQLGYIGLGLLEPFLIVFDYPHKRVALVERTRWVVTE